MATHTQTINRNETETGFRGQDDLYPAASGLVTAIDVGTTKVCALLGEKQPTGGIKFLAHSTTPCNGLRKGSVVDITTTSSAIKSAVRDLESSTGYKIDSAFISVTGAHISFQNRRDKLQPLTSTDVITADALSESGFPSITPDDPGQKLIQAIRMNYCVDGEVDIRNPIGMHSDELEIETHVVTGQTEILDRLSKAVRQAGISMTGMILEPLASAFAVLTDDEKERGVVMIDIGGGTTDIVAFKNGKICYTGVIPVGGFQFTNDIAITLNTPFQLAEKSKIRYGSTELHPLDGNKDVSFEVDDEGRALKVKASDINQIIRERAFELARLVQIKLSDSGLDENIINNIVLTGGASNLRGLVEFLRRTLSVEIRKGNPKEFLGLPEELRDGMYATSAGMLLWAMEEDPVSEDRGENPHNQNLIEEGARTGILWGLLNSINKLMP